MELTYSTSNTCTRAGPATQSVRRDVDLGDGKTLQIRSSGRFHHLAVALLGASAEAEQAAEGTTLSSRRVEGPTPCECVDTTVSIAGQRVRVHSWGRSHCVHLRVVCA